MDDLNYLVDLKTMNFPIHGGKAWGTVWICDEKTPYKSTHGVLVRSNQGQWFQCVDSHRMVKLDANKVKKALSEFVFLPTFHEQKTQSSTKNHPHLKSSMGMKPKF